MSKELRNSFDDIIRQALGDQQVPYDEHSWDMLERKMANTDMSEERSVDDLARRAMNDLEVPYNPSTWHILSDRLDRMNYRKRLIASKVFEAAVIFFAIFTMVKFLGQMPQVQQLLPKALVQEEGMIDHVHDAAILSNMEKEVGTNGNVRTAEIKLPLTEKLSQKAELKSQSRRYSGLNAGIPITDDRTSVDHDVVTTGDKFTYLLLPALQTLDFKIDPVSRRFEPPQRVKTSPMLPVFDLSMLEAETAVDFHSVVVTAPTPKIRTSIGLFYQYNTHLVNNFVSWSPVTKQKIESSQGQGVMTNVQFGRLGFELGASYSNVVYSAGTGENEIQKLQVPLNLKYTGLKTKYADFYAKGGASAHAVLRGHYEEPGFLAVAPGSVKQESYFNDGLLKGGYREFNTYYSINAGIGVDIPLFRNMGFFAESMYHDHWKGELGYTADKFRTFTYNIGMTYNFD